MANLIRSAKFEDLESDDKKDMSMSILPFDDQTYQTKMIEVETAIQVNQFDKFLKIMKNNSKKLFFS
jgi:hypothetical protein